jgi:hypothetical protein
MNHYKLSGILKKGGEKMNSVSEVVNALQRLLSYNLQSSTANNHAMSSFIPKEWTYQSAVIRGPCLLPMAIQTMNRYDTVLHELAWGKSGAEVGLFACHTRLLD